MTFSCFAPFLMLFEKLCDYLLLFHFNTFVNKALKHIHIVYIVFLVFR